jgi:hypothetical protein
VSGGRGDARRSRRNDQHPHEVRGWLSEPRTEREQLLRWIAGWPGVLAAVVVYWDSPRFIPGWAMPVLLIGLTVASCPPRRVMTWRWRLVRPWWTSSQALLRWYLAVTAATLPALAAEWHAGIGTGFAVSIAVLPLLFLSTARRARRPGAFREPVTQVAAPAMPGLPLAPGSPSEWMPVRADWPGSTEHAPAPGPPRHMARPDSGWHPPG